MSDLIGGPEVLRALADGFDVLWRSPEWSGDNWHSMLNDWCLDAKEILDEKCYREEIESYQPVIFKIKPKTITINGVEVPAPFEPIDGEECCYITDESIDGYHTVSYNSERYSSVFFGLYRPSDIKQVVLALKQAIHTKP